jgi:hypothetical protein
VKRALDERKGKKAALLFGSAVRVQRREGFSDAGVQELKNSSSYSSNYSRTRL